MTKKIKRIAALIVAGILLICISFASLAEEMAEESSAPEETEASAAPEAAETDEAPEPLPATETADTPEVKQQQESPEQNVPQETAETAKDAEDDYDAVIDDFDAGTVDPELIDIYFPNGTGAPETAGGDEGETENSETENHTGLTTNRAWIESEDNQKIHIGDPAILLAKAEPALNGEVTWEIRDARWEEGVWETIGKGERIELDVTEALANMLIRFVLEDGTVSEIFEMNAAEKPEDSNEEEAGETTGDPDDEAGIADEDATGEDGKDPEDTEGETEDAENVNEEPTVEIIRAWITAESVNSAADETGEGPADPAAVILTANAEPEMTGVNIWETRKGDAEEDTWERIGYGDQITAEITEENAGSLYRFVMQDGPVSEIYLLTAAAEEPKDEDEPADEAEEAEEEEEPELPEDRSIEVVISWAEPNPGFGSVAHFTAVLEGYEELEYTLQWITSTDNENWTEIEGATGETMDVVVTEENYMNYWRVRVHVEGFANEEEPEPAVPEEEEKPDSTLPEE